MDPNQIVQDLEDYEQVDFSIDLQLEAALGANVIAKTVVGTILSRGIIFDGLLRSVLTRKYRLSSRHEDRSCRLRRRMIIDDFDRIVPMYRPWMRWGSRLTHCFQISEVEDNVRSLEREVANLNLTEARATSQVIEATTLVLPPKTLIFEDGSFGGP
uniref:Uncharacterized protein n=1 Tax=Cannabis sativa TaxID=3483 RepID=A0A803QM63_CANSA